MIGYLKTSVPCYRVGKEGVQNFVQTSNPLP